MIEVYGLLFCSVIGTIGHFIYELSNKNKIIGYLFSTNESTWEHLKLGITPILMFSIVEILVLKNPNVIVNTCFKIITFTIFTITLYYVSKHILKKNIIILDLAIFYFSLAIAHLVSLKLLHNTYSIFTYLCSITLIALMFYAYKHFYKFKPNNFLFKY